MTSVRLTIHTQVKSEKISSRARRETPDLRTESQRKNIDVLPEQVCPLLCITWPVQLTHLSLWCRWYSTLCLVLAMPCPFPGLAACGKILTFISTTGPAATDTRSASDPYAQVPAFTICPTGPSPTHTCKHIHTKSIWAHTHTGMSDTSWPLAVPPWISRRGTTCRVRGDFGVKELGLEISHSVKPAGSKQVNQTGHTDKGLLFLFISF